MRDECIIEGTSYNIVMNVVLVYVCDPTKREKLRICVLHKFISKGSMPYWMKNKGLTAKDLCESYNYDVFFTGDNHKAFIYTYSKTNQLVINTGCITRQKYSEKDFCLK